MRFVFGLVLLLSASSFAQEGVLTVGRVSVDQSSASSADWYTMKPVGDISTLGSVITVSTTWSGLVLKGFLNPRRDSSVYVHCITVNGDTAKVSVATESYSGKLPAIAKVITATSSDSTIFLFQKR